MAFGDADARARLPKLAGVAIVHAAIGYALLSGLAYRVIHEPNTLSTYFVPDDPPPPPPNPEPLPRTHAKLPVPKMPPPLPQPIEPRFRQSEPVDWAKAINVVPVSIEPIQQPPVTAGGEPRPARPRADKASWITADDYPAEALRAGDEGSVAISVTLDAKGRVTSCDVTGSSGHPLLDAATCRLYRSRARYAPALDGSGAPIATTASDRVVWRIPG